MLLWKALQNISAKLAMKNENMEWSWWNSKTIEAVELFCKTFRFQRFFALKNVQFVKFEFELGLEFDKIIKTSKKIIKFWGKMRKKFS